MPPSLRGLRPGPCTGSEVRSATPSEIRTADALDAVAAGRAPGVTADEVHTVVFRKPPIGKRGYDEDAVDDLLDRVETALGGGPAAGIELNGRPLEA